MTYIHSKKDAPLTQEKIKGARQADLRDEIREPRILLASAEPMGLPKTDMKIAEATKVVEKFTDLLPQSRGKVTPEIEAVLTANNAKMSKETFVKAVQIVLTDDKLKKILGLAFVPPGPVLEAAIQSKYGAILGRMESSFTYLNGEKFKKEDLKPK